MEEMKSEETPKGGASIASSFYTADIYPSGKIETARSDIYEF